MNALLSPITHLIGPQIYDEKADFASLTNLGKIAEKGYCNIHIGKDGSVSDPYEDGYGASGYRTVRSAIGIGKNSGDVPRAFPLKRFDK